MSNTKEWEERYNKKGTTECPHCGREDFEHSCANCYSDMSKEKCWQYEGYCSKKCFDYIHTEIPKINALKEKMGIKCKCNDPSCAKCLTVSCKDDNCPTHTIERKTQAKKRFNK